MKTLVVFYSTYGPIHQMAEAVAEGVKQVNGAEVELRRVPETLPEGVLEQMRIDEITGGSPYGASTIAGGDGSRMPGENEYQR
ncbi:MAG: hypothetical protein GY850_04965 [bacterium]|nr:hypothetical protein [bacterium]